MRNAHLAACALATALCGIGLALGLAHRAAAAPLGPVGRGGDWRGSEQADVIRVGDRCSRCRRCDDGPPLRSYYVPRYEPSVVYYGPSGIYRPYPPVVVYDAPVYAPYYSSWRYATDSYYYRRW